jgi:hypothetical protein
MRTVIRMLAIMIEKNDPRWKEFGLNIRAPKWKQPVYRQPSGSSGNAAEVIELGYGAGEEALARGEALIAVAVRLFARRSARSWAN